MNEWRVAVKYVRVGSGTDVDPRWDTGGFEFVGQSDVVAKEAVAGHFATDYTRQHRARVQTDADLTLLIINRSINRIKKSRVQYVREWVDRRECVGWSRPRPCTAPSRRSAARESNSSDANHQQRSKRLRLSPPFVN